MNVIRRAILEETEAITGVLRRSKAHWNYDAATMELFMPLMVITIEEITTNHVYVMEGENQQIIGFYRASIGENGARLDDLFIDPPFIGYGYGKQMFLHAAELFNKLGYSEFTLEADPNAESFYINMGAIRIGSRESMIPGRFLPQMKYQIN